MPKISVNRRDLVSLVGRELSNRELEEALPNIKCGLEGLDGDCISLETTHERPDLIGAEGVARSLRAYLGIDRGIKRYKPKRSGLVANVDRSVFPDRPHTRMFVVKKVQMSPDLIEQLMQLQEKLHLMYGENRRAASIGVYDLGTFRWPIAYCAKKDYKFVPLGEKVEMSCAEVLKKTEKGREYAHLIGKKFPLILDANGSALSMPPVLNSEGTKVTAKTDSLFVDVSGTDERVVEKASILMAAALAERGDVQSVTMRFPDRELESPSMETSFRRVALEYINRLIGHEFKEKDAVLLLEKMGFGAKASGGMIDVEIPAYRFDILHDCDIAEEVAIGHGYNRFEPVLPQVSTIGRRHPVERLSEQAREVMVGAGFQEVLTYMLCPKSALRKAKVDGPFVELANPVSEEYNCVRSSLLPRHFMALCDNKHHPLPHRIFEAEDCVETDGKTTRTVRKVASIVSDTGATFTGMKSVLDALMRCLGVKYELSESDSGTFIKGRCGRVMIRGKAVGIIGEVSPEVLCAFGLEHPAAAFELDLEALPRP